MTPRPASGIKPKKLVRILIPAALVVAVVAVALGLPVYRMSHPAPVQETVAPSHYLMASIDFALPVGNGVHLPAWWIPGLKGAPAIILSPGYGMARSDALSLAAVLHDKGYNLLVYSQRGSGPEAKSASTLGLREADDLAEAIRYVRERPESDANRIGVWGVDIGALAALRTAASFSEVRAIVADNPVASEADFIGYRLLEDYGISSRLMALGCYQVFRLAHAFGGAVSHREIPMEEIAARTVLFIKGENRRELGRLTNALYQQIEPRKEMISFKTARVRVMSGEELKSYDRQVANFFALNLR